MKNITILLFCLSMLNISLSAQNAPFTVVLEPMSIPDLGGIQSYAFGQDKGKWLIVGGRLDGLHRRQPWASFDIAGHNNQLIVVDPISLKRWMTSLSSLPVSIQEHLSSTNMQFHQEGDYLYCIGGYGYSESYGDHTTFSNLTAIKVSAVIDAIISNSNIDSYFRQIADPQFQVTGGRLRKINKEYYLLGGQKFIGRYNPMGPTHGPGFEQEYTDAIRKFTLEDDGTMINLRHLTSFVDRENLHRRDYNAEPQILPDGQEGITMFSGVFQNDENLPFLNSVTIDSEAYTVNNSFQQYYNHYHCATVPLYSELNNEMHTVFFGGIAQYYESEGVLVQDDDVPFVKTVARVTRDSSGKMAEYKLPIEMPVMLGAASEFIPNRHIPHYPNEVLKLDELGSEATLVGYIFGGISSSARNIFFTNTGEESAASSQIFKVLISKDKPLEAHSLNEHSIGSLNLQVFPNPGYGEFVLFYNLEVAADVNFTLADMNGQILLRKTLEDQKIGKNIYRQEVENIMDGGIYILTIESQSEKASLKLIVEP